MFLSKIQLEWRWAKDPYQQHRALWSLFPDQPDKARDFLFRVESLQSGRGALILLQSQAEPQSSVQATILAAKDIHINLSEQSVLRFRLRANPVKTIKDQQGRLNKKGEVKTCRVPLVRDDEQLAWLARKFAGVATLQTAEVVQERPWFFRKVEKERSQHTETQAHTHAGKIQPVCFEGVLHVNNVTAFGQLLEQGIGPAKAMGCGLLSLASA